MTVQTQSLAGGSDSASSVLGCARASYETLLTVVKALGTRNPEALLSLIDGVAEFCQFHHTGLYADGRLENLALEIGRGLEATVGTPLPRGDWPHLLHVATSIQAVGGHTRTIKNWINTDGSAAHSLLLTRQGAQPIPAWMADTVRASGGELIVQRDDWSLVRRAAHLRQTAAGGASFVVLHHFGHDVIPVAAFAQAGGPPVGLVNHADHLFWMGNSVADVVIQQRPLSSVLNARRGVRREVVVPVPLGEIDETPARETARSALGVAADEVVVMSTGRATKYAPTERHNFVRAARRILAACPKARVYVLGVSAAERARYFGADAHERLHFLGAVPDVARYLRAADVYLEGFPFGSQTALLEAALSGLPAVLAFAPPLPLLATSDASLVGLLATPPSEDEYVAQAQRLIEDARWRVQLGSQLRERVRSCHVGAGWRECLQELYRLAGTLHHQPAPVAAFAPQATADDVALGTWQAASRAGQQGRDEVREVVRAAAFYSRQQGDYRGALAILRHAARRRGWDTVVARELAKLLPHWTKRQCRRVWEAVAR